MKILESLLTILFFVTWMLYDIFFATKAIMVGITAVVILRLLRGQQIEKVTWITFFLIVVSGSLTVITENEVFIQVKPTLLFWLFAGVLGTGQLFKKRYWIQTFFPKGVTLPKRVWRNLNSAWSLCFLLLGLVNLFIVTKMSVTAWVYFKAFGILIATTLFAIGQAVYLHKYVAKKR